MLITASIINASTSVHIRGHRWTITPLDALPWQLAGASLVMLILATTVDGAPVVEWTPALVGIVAYQGILASGIALWAQIVVLRNIDPVSANLTMMGVPAIGVILGSSSRRTVTPGSPSAWYSSSRLWPSICWAARPARPAPSRRTAG
jgi:drug/metabolite transporter (DMT)-like permease